MVRRAAEEKMLMLHRLVQVVLKDAMAPQVYSEWAGRAVHVANQALPTALSSRLLLARW